MPTKKTSATKSAIAPANSRKSATARSSVTKPAPSPKKSLAKARPAAPPPPEPKPVVKSNKSGSGGKSKRRDAIRAAGNGQDKRASTREPEHRPRRPVPVPTDGKRAKNEVGMKNSELDVFREQLLAKRRELVGDMGQMETEALRRGGGSNLSNLPLHMADMGTDNYEQEFTLGLMEKDRILLQEINAALAKIQDGTYGICEGTGKPIGKPRLEAQPWARHSIEYARKIERRIGR